jgi:hypothetical protein
MIQKYEKMLAEDKIAYNTLETELVQLSDTAQTEIANFIQNGTKKQIDNTGSCLMELPAGNYVVLIYTNHCRTKTGIYKDGYYYAKKVTIAADSTSTIEHTTCNN